MLTGKQKELLDYIAAFQREKGISPSYEQMQIALGLKSKSGVHRLVNGLQERGHIRRLYGKARAIEIVGAPSLEIEVRSARSLSTPAMLQELYRRGAIPKALLAA